MRKIINPWLPYETHYGFGTSVHNPYSLRMEFYEDNGDVVCFWKPRREYEGWVGMMNGGILGTLVDETSSWVVFLKYQRAAVTARMEVRYRQPVKVSESQITIRASFKERHNRLVTIDSKIVDSRGKTCVEGHSDFFLLDEKASESMLFKKVDVDDEMLLPF